MLDGWIKLHRHTLENPVIMKDADHFAIWTYLLLNASHKEHDFMLGSMKTRLKEGQLVTGRKSISDKLKINESKVQRVLKLFENEHLIKQQTNNKNRVISILCWQLEQKDEQQDKQQTNNKRTASEQQMNTYNNDKNVENDKKINKYSHLEADISEIRKLYPGNKNKAGAYKKLPKLIEKYGKEQLIRCIERYNQYVQNTRADGFASLQYKNESTFWNGGYIDYLDENVSQEIVSQSKEEVEYDNTRFTPEQLEAYYRTDPEDEDLPF